MKILNIFLLIIDILSPNLFSQQTDVSVNLNPLPNTAKDYTVEINLVLPLTPSDGVVIEVPQEIQLIPVAISLNDSQIWLQNMLAVPSQDSVVAWQSVSEGIMIVFKKGLLKTGDQIKLPCLTTIHNPDLSQNLLTTKELVSHTDGLRITNESFTSGSM